MKQRESEHVRLEIEHTLPHRHGWHESAPSRFLGVMLVSTSLCTRVLPSLGQFATVPPGRTNVSIGIFY